MRLRPRSPARRSSRVLAGRARRDEEHARGSGGEAKGEPGSGRRQEVREEKERRRERDDADETAWRVRERQRSRQ